MASHKAAFDAGEVERLVILVVVILGAEVFIPVAGHILLEESYKVFEELKAIIAAAVNATREVYKRGFGYKKSSVVISKLIPEAGVVRSRSPDECHI